MNGFPTGLLIALAAAILFLMIAGVALWRLMFSEDSSYKSHSHYKERPPEKPTADSVAQSIEEVPQGEALNAKTVSSSDTINNQSDDDVIELQENPVGGKQTVETAGDVSVSMDDD